MILVLPYALPPAPYATELGKRLPAAAPTLAGWFARAPAQMQRLAPEQTCCTPLEAWQLRRAGYVPAGDAPLGAGWAVLADPTSLTAVESPFWLAELAHLQVTHQGVVLTDPDSLDLESEEGAALQETALQLLRDAGITGTAVSPRRLRLSLPDGMAPYAPTPAAAAGQDIHDWWPQQVAYRPWRRALNMVQMAWHDHPVNQRRAARGLPVVNGLWLYGGARPADFAPAERKLGAPVIENALSGAAKRGDWAVWLEHLAQIEASRLRPLQTRLDRQGETLTLVLTGVDRLAQLELRAPRGLARWLPRRAVAWHAWWDAA